MFIPCDKHMHVAQDVLLDRELYNHVMHTSEIIEEGRLIHFHFA